MPRGRFVREVCRLGVQSGLGRDISWISPKAAFERQAYREALEIKEKQAEARRNYDAGSIDRFNNRASAAWGSGELVDKPYRQRLLLIARDLERNNDIAKSIISPFERNVVGLGINLQAKTDDEVLNEQLEELGMSGVNSRTAT